MPRLRRPLYLVGAISLAVLAVVALPRASAPRGRHGRRAANHRDGPAWRQLRRRRATRSTRSRVRTTSTSRTSAGTTSDPNQISRARCSLSGGGAAAGGATQVTPVALAVVPTQPRLLDQPFDSGAATSTPSIATPARRPRRPKTGARGRCRRHQLGLAGHRPDHPASTTTPAHRHRRQPGRPRHRGGRRQGHVQRQRRARPGQPDHRQPPERLHHGSRTTALLVKTGQDVKRGAKIAEIGQSDATSPRLHFEIRPPGHAC